MKREFSLREGKELCRKHLDLLDQLAKIYDLEQKYRGDISVAVKTATWEDALKLLKEIPVEELNRDKKGIRIKTLKDAGFNTVADIVRVSSRRIEQINGIGPEGAGIIKKAADDIAAEASKSAKLRLSMDHKTKEANAVVMAVARYMSVYESIREAKNLLKENGTEIQNAVKALLPTLGILKWAFTSGADKAKAAESYKLLSSLIAEGYETKALETSKALKQADRIMANDAWKQFAEDSIRFYNVLEEVTPGVMGADESIYGLPEDLAKAIQEEPIDTRGLKCTLRRYQEWGVRYILHQKRVLLGDEMGLGKTIQAIAAMVSLRNGGGHHFVVVCPASVITNWCREIEKHSDLTVIKVHGQSKEKKFEEWLYNGGVAVTTFETTGIFNLNEKYVFDMLVVDEAHYVKNPEANRTIHVRAIASHARNILFMTGTALENRVDEMISLIQVLQPEIAKAVHGMEALSTAPRFRETVAPVYYRRKRDDVLTELPELIETEEWCDLLPEEEAVYEESLYGRNMADIRRVSWNMEDLTKSSKAQRLLEIVEEAREEERKVIVFSFYLDTIRKVTELLGAQCMEVINGSVPPQRRQEIVDEFDKAPAGSVLPAQIQAGGTGLNIQSASVVVICEPQFKPSIENQAVSRAYRMGQTRNVLVYRLLCDETIDERIMEILKTKQGIFDAFADQSVVADQSMELDQSTFQQMVDEEIKARNLNPELRSESPDSDQSHAGLSQQSSPQTSSDESQISHSETEL